MLANQIPNFMSTRVNPEGHGLYQMVIKIALALSFSLPLYSQPGTVDDSFNDIDPGFLNGAAANSTVNSVLKMSDGRYLIGGSFTAFNGVARNGIARLNADGSLDTTFNPGSGLNTNGFVSDIVLQSSGKIIISGFFSTVNGIVCGNIARLNPDGSVDSNFNAGTGANGEIRGMAVLSDDKIVIAGPSTFNGISTNRVARLNVDGSLDNSFSVGFSSFAIWSLVNQANDQVFVNAWRLINGSSQYQVLRLNTDGSIDSTFDAGTGGNNMIRDMAIQSDGKLVLGGWFTTFNGVSRNRVVRLNTDGNIDNSFNPGSGANSFVNTMAIQADGKILAGGGFTSFNGVTHNRIVRMLSDGSLDPSFDASVGADNSVFTLLPQSDGKLMVAGSFTSYNGVAAGNLLKVDDNNQLDPSFNPVMGANDLVQVIQTQPDGKILIGGDFTTFNGTVVNRIARLHPNGSLDNSFNQGSGVDNTIRAIAFQSDGKILIAGDFKEYNGHTINRIARLNTDGSLDTTFDPGLGPSNNIHSINSLYDLAIRQDGKILVAGTFAGWDGWPYNRMVLLNPDGSTDIQFNRHIGSSAIQSGANLAIRSLVVQPDGKMLIAGEFTSYNGSTIYRVARLFADGNIDPSFTTGLGAAWHLYDLALQPDGKILIAGPFMSFQNCTSCTRIGRLNADGSPDNSFNTGAGPNGVVKAIAIQADGKILLAGEFTSVNGGSSKHLTRLLSNGSIDSSFVSGSGADDDVESLHLQSDGRLLIGGAFTSFSGVGRTRLARINTTSTTTPTVSTDSVSMVTTNAAQVWANISSNGGASVISRGILIGMNPGLSLADSAIVSGTGTGSFNVALQNLSAGDTYYVRAFATNSEGTVYGAELNFTTQSPCDSSLFTQGTLVDNYAIRFRWKNTGGGTYAIYLRELGQSTWLQFLSNDTSRVLQNRAPGQYEYYVEDITSGIYSCTQGFSVPCADDITYSYNAFQAPELGRLGRVRVFGTQGGKRLYDIHLVDESGDSTSVLNVRQRNYTDLLAGDYSLYVQDDFGCVADSIGQFTVVPLDSAYIPNLISALDNAPNGFIPTWHSVDGVINYQLRVVNVTDGTLQLFQTGINDTLFAVTNLPTGKLYRFNVRSRYNNGVANVVSGYSNAVSRNLPVGGNKGEQGSTEEELANSLNVQVYPNPTSGMFYVQAPEGSNLTLIDMNGKAIAKRTAKGTEEIMDLTELAQGVYLLEVNYAGQLYRERVVKQ